MSWFKRQKFISLTVALTLLIQQSGFAQSIDLSQVVSQMMPGRFLQESYRPVHLRGLGLDESTGNFNLLLDKGTRARLDVDVPHPTSHVPGALTPDVPHPTSHIPQSEILFTYFLTGLTLPNDVFWVNLRPDGEDNIIDSELAQTDLGKAMLEADLQLKKDTARLTSPETTQGKVYWEKLYAKAAELFGTSEMTIPTMIRPWIVPDEVIIREANGEAYIYKATLKVMLEEDHIAVGAGRDLPFKMYTFEDERLKQLNQYAAELARAEIIPQLTREVNTSEKYAPLKQVYYSLILAQWFKAYYRGKETGYSQMIDSHDLSGLTSQVSWSVKEYFDAYKQSFQQGEHSSTMQLGGTLRNFVSGGVQFGATAASGISPTGAIPGIEGVNFAASSALAAVRVDARGKVSVASSAVQVKEAPTDRGIDFTLSPAVSKGELVPVTPAETTKAVFVPQLGVIPMTPGEEAFFTLTKGTFNAKQVDEGIIPAISYLEQQLTIAANESKPGAVSRILFDLWWKAVQRAQKTGELRVGEAVKSLFLMDESMLRIGNLEPAVLLVFTAMCKDAFTAPGTETVDWAKDTIAGQVVSRILDTFEPRTEVTQFEAHVINETASTFVRYLDDGNDAHRRLAKRMNVLLLSLGNRRAIVQQSESAQKSTPDSGKQVAPIPAPGHRLTLFFPSFRLPSLFSRGFFNDYRQLNNAIDDLTSLVMESRAAYFLENGTEIINGRTEPESQFPEKSEHAIAVIAAAHGKSFLISRKAFNFIRWLQEMIEDSTYEKRRDYHFRHAELAILTTIAVHKAASDDAACLCYKFIYNLSMSDGYSGEVGKKMLADMNAADLNRVIKLRRQLRRLEEIRPYRLPSDTIPFDPLSRSSKSTSSNEFPEADFQEAYTYLLGKLGEDVLDRLMARSETEKEPYDSFRNFIGHFIPNIGEAPAIRSGFEWLLEQLGTDAVGRLVLASDGFNLWKRMNTFEMQKAITYLKTTHGPEIAVTALVWQSHQWHDDDSFITQTNKVLLESMLHSSGLGIPDAVIRTIAEQVRVSKLNLDDYLLIAKAARSFFDHHFDGTVAGHVFKRIIEEPAGKARRLLRAISSHGVLHQIKAAVERIPGTPHSSIISENIVAQLERASAAAGSAVALDASGNVQSASSSLMMLKPAAVAESVARSLYEQDKRTSLLSDEYAQAWELRAFERSRNGRPNETTLEEEAAALVDGSPLGKFLFAEPISVGFRPARIPERGDYMTDSFETLPPIWQAYYHEAGMRAEAAVQSARDSGISMDVLMDTILDALTELDIDLSKTKNLRVNRFVQGSRKRDREILFQAGESFRKNWLERFGYSEYGDEKQPFADQSSHVQRFILEILRDAAVKSGVDATGSIERRQRIAHRDVLIQKVAARMYETINGSTQKWDGERYWAEFALRAIEKLVFDGELLPEYRAAFAAGLSDVMEHGTSFHRGDQDRLDAFFAKGSVYENAYLLAEGVYGDWSRNSSTMFAEWGSVEFQEKAFRVLIAATDVVADDRSGNFTPGSSFSTTVSPVDGEKTDGINDSTALTINAQEGPPEGGDTAASSAVSDRVESAAGELFQGDRKAGVLSDFIPAGDAEEARRLREEFEAGSRPGRVVATVDGKYGIDRSQADFSDLPGHEQERYRALARMYAEKIEESGLGEAAFGQALGELLARVRNTAAKLEEEFIDASAARVTVVAVVEGLLAELLPDMGYADFRGLNIVGQLYVLNRVTSGARALGITVSSGDVVAEGAVDIGTLTARYKAALKAAESVEQIKALWREIIKVLHPDVLKQQPDINPDDLELANAGFIALKNFYEIYLALLESEAQVRAAREGEEIRFLPSPAQAGQGDISPSAAAKQADMVIPASLVVEQSAGDLKEQGRFAVYDPDDLKSDTLKEHREKISALAEEGMANVIGLFMAGVAALAKQEKISAVEYVYGIQDGSLVVRVDGAGGIMDLLKAHLPQDTGGKTTGKELYPRIRKVLGTNPVNGLVNLRVALEKATGVSVGYDETGVWMRVPQEKPVLPEEDVADLVIKLMDILTSIKIRKANKDLIIKLVISRGNIAEILTVIANVIRTLADYEVDRNDIRDILETALIRADAVEMLSAVAASVKSHRAIRSTRIGSLLNHILLREDAKETLAVIVNTAEQLRFVNASYFRSPYPGGDEEITAREINSLLEEVLERKFPLEAITAMGNVIARLSEADRESGYVIISMVKDALGIRIEDPAIIPNAKDAGFELKFKLARYTHRLRMYPERVATFVHRVVLHAPYNPQIAATLDDPRFIDQISIMLRGPTHAQTALTASSKLPQVSTSPSSGQASSSIDAELRSRSVPETADKGGIDFHSIPAFMIPAGGLLGLVDLNAPEVLAADAQGVWQQLNELVDGDVEPDSSQIKLYVSACLRDGTLEDRISPILCCIARSLRIEEDLVKQTDPALKDLLVALETSGAQGARYAMNRKVVQRPGIGSMEVAVIREEEKV